LGVEDPLQLADARTLRHAIKRRTESVGADQIEPVGLIDGVFDLLRRQLGREVDEDGDRITDRKSTYETGRAVVSPSVQADPVPLAEDRTRYRHIDRTAGLRPQPP
jgi:hypothetical protein